jgi:glycosyltransferase involved in cell wall biosynthesis
MGIGQVHLWAYKSLSDAVPDFPWLKKHSPKVLEKSIFNQVWWQYHYLPKEIHATGCQLIFNTDAGSVCPFRPSITMSQDMLSYEPGEMNRFWLSNAWFRLLLLKYIQSSSLRRADSVIFLTNYAAEVIQKTTGKLKNYKVIHHGVGSNFRLPLVKRRIVTVSDKQIKVLYVSNASMYKHQWHVIRAVGKIRSEGIDVSLLLVGGGKGRAQILLEKEMYLTDPNCEFVEQKPFADHDSIPDYLAKADMFVFASSCENMPITLIEAMASGLPIACSNRGPMPEVLIDGGVYFDPENPDSIASAIRKIIYDQNLQKAITKRAIEISASFSWEKCSTETWKLIAECAIANK